MNVIWKSKIIFNEKLFFKIFSNKNSFYIFVIVFRECLSEFIKIKFFKFYLRNIML